jgi:assimilatory nitrate reductase catalytic subunit
MSAPARIIRTTCPYCGTGCGVEARIAPSGEVQIAGDKEHPANFGRLCVKGAALAQTLTSEGRLLHPAIEGARTNWSVALRLVADRFRETIAIHGPDSVALYVSGQMLTEDYYVANKFMKGFVGSANIDTNSRLCMASSVAGHKRAFGADVVPNVYEDLELADLVVLVGSNLAWCHPVLFQRLEHAKTTRPSMRVVNIDPRRTATSEIADLHLALKPGSDVALFLGLMRYLQHAGKANAAYVTRHTLGVEDALLEAQAWDIEKVAGATGLEAASIAHFYELFAERDRVVSVYSQGVNQSAAGTDKVNAILNCHLLTGRIGKPGSGPFSVTGQPNAMGGREVGGLANQLACHMELENPLHREIVRRFWGAERIAAKPGLKAVELFDAVGAGKIKALWIIGTNPADSLPEADKVRDGLRACPFVVVSDAMAETDTTALAHVLLPARPWGEKDGSVTNSERRISRQRPLRAAAGLAMPDWWIICRVAQLMGASGFDFAGPAQIFHEYAALSGHLNLGERAFDISACADLGIGAYEHMQPFQWPSRRGEPKRKGASRFFAEGGFFTADGRARFIVTPFRAPQKAPTPKRPFVLNTGRVRDQWHTMTRTGVAPRLSQHIAEPFAEIHPADARRLGVEPASLMRVSNAQGSVILRALVTDRQQKGALFAPIHWTDQNTSAGRVDALIAANLDPVSGQPESKACTVRAERWPAAWFGFAVTRVRPTNISAGYWALARTGFGWRIELAGQTELEDWDAFARRLLGVENCAGHAISKLEDRGAGSRRWLAYDDERPAGLLIVSPEPVVASRAFICEEFEKRELSDARALLAGRPTSAGCDRGRTICVCHGVGSKDIESAILAHALSDAEAVGRATKAGTGCGSCRPEIQGLLVRTAAQQRSSIPTPQAAPVTRKLEPVA